MTGSNLFMVQLGYALQCQYSRPIVLDLTWEWRMLCTLKKWQNKTSVMKHIANVSAEDVTDYCYFYVVMK